MTLCAVYHLCSKMTLAIFKNLSKVSRHDSKNKLLIKKKKVAGIFIQKFHAGMYILTEFVIHCITYDVLYSVLFFFSVHFTSKFDASCDTDRFSSILCVLTPSCLKNFHFLYKGWGWDHKILVQQTTVPCFVLVAILTFFPSFTQQEPYPLLTDLGWGLNSSLWRSVLCLWVTTYIPRARVPLIKYICNST